MSNFFENRNIPEYPAEIGRLYNCKEANLSESSLIEVEYIGEIDEFKEMLPYINTM